LVGLGCALIRTKVFREVQYPYFMCHSPKFKKEGVNISEDGGVNEDAHFSELLYENGYKINILNNLKCIHIDFDKRRMYGYDKEFNIEK
jgi:hypothetical protein